MAKGPYEPAKIPTSDPKPAQGGSPMFGVDIPKLEARIEEVLRQNTLYQEKTVAQLTSLRNEMNAMNEATLGRVCAYRMWGGQIIELQAKLKETIRAVERLAGGKSLGNLGLPTEESWQKSTS